MRYTPGLRETLVSLPSILGEAFFLTIGPQVHETGAKAHCIPALTNATPDNASRDSPQPCLLGPTERYHHSLPPAVKVPTSARVDTNRPLLVLIYLAIAVASVWLLQFLWHLLGQASVFVVILLVAWILTVAALGPVRILRRLMIPLPIAAAVIYLGLLSLVGVALFFVLPPFFEQVGRAAENLTQQALGIPEGMRALESRLISLGVPEDFVRSTITDVSRQLVSLGQDLASGILAATGTLAGGLAAALVTLIISFYLLLGWDRTVRNLEAILPKTWAEGFHRAIGAAEHTFGGWLVGQFIASLLWGGSIVITYFIAGLEFGLLVAVGTGLLLFIPIIGMVIGIGIPIAMAAAIRIDLAVWVGLTATLVSLVIENVVKPRVMGSTIGVSPIVVLSSVILGGIAAGFWGVLFGIPIGALLWTFTRWSVMEFLQSQRRTIPPTTNTTEPSAHRCRSEDKSSAKNASTVNDGSPKETQS